MKDLTKSVFQCEICKKKYNNSLDAYKCEEQGPRSFLKKFIEWYFKRWLLKNPEPIWQGNVFYSSFSREREFKAYEHDHSQWIRKLKYEIGIKD